MKAAPPSKAMSKAVSKARSAVVATTPPGAQAPFVKRLHWRPLESTAVAETVFGELGDKLKEATLDVRMLHKVFDSEPSGPATARKEKLLARRESFAPRPMGVCLLDPKRAHTLGIILKRCPVPFAALCEALRRGDFSAGLSEEDISVLLRAWPTPEEQRLVASHVGAASQLRDVERCVQQVATIPRSEARLRFMHLAGSLAGFHRTLNEGVGLMHRACSELRASGRWRELLVAALGLGNYINHGDCAKQRAQGFTIQALLELQKFKGAGGLTALHCLCVVCARRDARFCSGLFSELRSVQAAARVSVGTLQEQLQRLDAELAVSARELMQHREAYSRPVPPAPAVASLNGSPVHRGLAELRLQQVPTAEEPPMQGRWTPQRSAGLADLACCEDATPAAFTPQALSDFSPAPSPGVAATPPVLRAAQMPQRRRPGLVSRRVSWPLPESRLREEATRPPATPPRCKALTSTAASINETPSPCKNSHSITGVSPARASRRDPKTPAEQQLPSEPPAAGLPGVAPRATPHAEREDATRPPATPTRCKALTSIAASISETPSPCKNVVSPARASGRGPKTPAQQQLPSEPRSAGLPAPHTEREAGAPRTPSPRGRGGCLAASAGSPGAVQRAGACAGEEASMACATAIQLTPDASSHVPCGMESPSTCGREPERISLSTPHRAEQPEAQRLGKAAAPSAAGGQCRTLPPAWPGCGLHADACGANSSPSVPAQHVNGGWPAGDPGRQRNGSSGCVALAAAPGSNATVPLAPGHVRNATEAAKAEPQGQAALQRLDALVSRGVLLAHCAREELAQAVAGANGTERYLAGGMSAAGPAPARGCAPPGGKDGRAPGEQFFGAVAEFLVAFRTSWDEVHRNEQRWAQYVGLAKPGTSGWAC